MKKLFSILLGIMLLTGCAKQIATTYTYADGSGNSYVITQNTIEYTPIEPANSSSGEYDGGEYAKKEITETEYNAVASLLNEAVSDTAIHIDNRVKKSGWIEIQKGDTITASVIIQPNTEKQLQIEKLLNDLLL